MSLHAHQYLLVDAVSETKGFVPTMLVIHTLRPDHLNAAAPFDDLVDCISALTGDHFQIRLMPKLDREQQIRLAYLAQAVEMGCGWHTVVLAKHPTSPPCSFLVDHERQILYVGVELLGQSHEVVLNLARHVTEYLKNASDRQNPGCGGFFVHGHDRRMLIGQTASITLIIDREKGVLRFPSFVTLSPGEQTVHVATVGDEVYIRSATWRLFNRAYEVLPYYSYWIEAEKDTVSYFIPVPLEVLYSLRNGPKLTFRVYAI